MLAGPQRYAEHLTKEQYHPRSNKHGMALARFVLDDLLATCAPLRNAAVAGKVVYAQNYDVFSSSRVTAGVPANIIKDLAWNIDLVIGPVGTSQGQLFPLNAGTINEGKPGAIWLTVDAKGVMTKHENARRNRQRDATALAAVMHLFYPSVVVGAVIPVNIARKFRSPTQKKKATITDHGANIAEVVSVTMDVFRAAKAIAGYLGSGGIEALGSFVVDFANTAKSVATVLIDPPAPQPGDIIHYDRFIGDLAASLVQRFGSQM